MKNYKKIHIWDFPYTLTYVKLNKSFRNTLFQTLINKLGSQQKVMNFINSVSLNYSLRRKYKHGNLYSWIKGQKFDRGKIKSINVPLWILIEISKFLSNSEKVDNGVMKNIQENILFYTSIGNANPVKYPKLPIMVNPEFISIIFHFCGDGHLGNKRDCCSYKQKK